MKKYLYIILLIIILIIIFSFIAIKKEKDNNNTVVFWTLQLGTFDKYINRVIYDFEKENPNIKIKWIDVPYSEGEKRTLASVLTDNPPDLINLTPDFSLLLAQKGALYNIAPEYLKEYPKSITNMLKYNENYFGIPFYATSAVTLYNNKFNINIIPKTYDDLFNIKIDKSSGFITMISFCENDTLLKILNKYNINSPETIKSKKSINIYKILKNLYDENRIPKESITQSHRDALEKYMSGQLAFIVTGANFINMIKENAPLIYKTTEVLPQLTGDTGLYDFSLMNFVIPKKAKNPQAAIKFAIFLTNKSNQLEFAKMTTILPVNKLALQDEYFTSSKDNSDIQTIARIISAKQLNNLQPPLKNIKNKKELNTMSANYLQDILINNADIEKTLIEFSENWEKL